MKAKTDVTVIDWPLIEEAADIIADRWRNLGVEGVYGVPRGGVVPALLVAQRLGVPLVSETGDRVLVVDDLIDSGTTRERYVWFDALFSKSEHPDAAIVRDGWLVFPWEQQTESTGPSDAVIRILEFIGEDPHREGLVDTPARVIKAWRELTSGYHLDAADVLSTTFDIGQSCDELVMVTGVHFDSMCEHHMLPFSGTVDVGYLPGERVVGLSKLARLVEVYARRLQVQERMTSQIASAIMEHLDARAAGVVVRGRHSCMSCRGVRKPADMVTSSMLGRLREDAAMRAEFMALISG